VFNQSMRILLAKDDVGLRKTMAVLLRTAGLRVDTARDASEAFRVIARHQYDIAVVDMVLLPAPSGIEVIRNLRSTSPGTHVITCTAYCSGELRAEALALSVERIMRKPVAPSLLALLIQNPTDPVRLRHQPVHDCQVRVMISIERSFGRDQGQVS